MKAVLLTRRRMLAAAGGLVALAAPQHAGAGETPQVQLPSMTRNRGKDSMQITRIGSQPSSKGPAEYFTGTVRLDSRFAGTEPARVGGAIVTFEPGACTAWHTHPLGQTLIIMSGSAWVQVEGGPREDVRPGDIVWFPPGEKHWHGATATTAMTHIAIAEQLNGKAVDWLEQVTDDQYRR
jgi:quercetin dioxygenase-like cupin family protein